MEKGVEKMNIIKKDAMKIINKLPDNVNWDDIIYEFYVKKKISNALKDVGKGRIIPHKDVKKKFIYNED